MCKLWEKKDAPPEEVEKDWLKVIIIIPDDGEIRCRFPDEDSLATFLAGAEIDISCCIVKK